MAAYLLSRLVYAAGVVLLVSLITFALIHAAPGGPALLQNPTLSQAQAEAIARTLGLDRPWPEQYVAWLRGTLHGEFGVSLTYERPVGPLVLSSLGPTAALAGAALVFALAVGIPLGMSAAIRPFSARDHLVTAISLVGFCTPVFWLSIVLILVFSLRLGVLPSGGMTTTVGQIRAPDFLAHLVLPALALGASPMAQLARYTRAAALGAFAGEYVRTAHAKGVPPRRVLYGHVLRNAAIPVISIVGLLIPRLISNGAVTEAVFAWPGLGYLAVAASLQRDYPVIMDVTLLVSVLVVGVNLLTDVLYGYVDPRITFR